MKKKLFDIRLFTEALRRLRTPAVFLLAVNTLAAMLVSIGYVMSRSGAVPVIPRSLNAVSLHPFLLSAFLLAAPVFMLILFSYTTTRRGSDFYDAVPQTRVCVFLSFFAAVLCCLAVLCFGTSLAAGVTASLFPRYLRFVWSELLLYSWHMFLCSLYVSAAFACGIFLTGTVFTNIVVSLLILFAPRLILTVMVENVVAASGVLVSGRLFPLFSFDINMVFGFFTQLLGFGMPQYLVRTDAGLYTLILGLLLTAGAALLDRVRRSETAEVAAPNKILGAVYRLTLAFVICLIPVTFIFQTAARRQPVTGSFVFEQIVLYLIAVIAFLAYELIATRRLKKLAESLPSLLLLPLLNLAVLGVMFFSLSAARSYRPDADDLAYVRLVRGYADNYSFSEEMPYFTRREDEIRLTDPDALRIVSAGLKRALHYTDPAPDMDSSYQSAMTSRIVVLKSGLRERTRIIYVTQTESQTLDKKLTESPGLRDMYMDLLPADDPSLFLYFLGLGGEESPLSEDAAKRIYTIFRSEVEEKGFDVWYSVSRGAPDSLDILRVRLSRSGRLYYFNVPIAPAFSKTYEAYLSEIQDVNTALQQEVITALRNDPSRYLNAQLYVPGTSPEYLFFNIKETGAADLLQQASGRTLDPEKTLLRVMTTVTKLEKGTWISRDITALFVLEPEEAEQFRSMSRLEPEPYSLPAAVDD